MCRHKIYWRHAQRRRQYNLSLRICDSNECLTLIRCYQLIALPSVFHSFGVIIFLSMLVILCNFQLIIFYLFSHYFSIVSSPANAPVLQVLLAHYKFVYLLICIFTYFKDLQYHKFLGEMQLVAFSPSPIVGSSVCVCPHASLVDQRKTV